MGLSLILLEGEMDEFSGDRDLAVDEHDDFVNTYAEQTAEKRPGLYWVAIYDVNKLFGGPEEGGWWYTAGELVTDPEVYEETLPMAFREEDRAKTYRDKMELRAKVQNKLEGRRDIGSVISTGQYFAEIHEGSLPAFYPERKPHYE
jgi:hypothetical protein